MLEDLLLGGHKRTVRDLHMRVNQIREEAYDGPNILLLRGPSGVGKSRIIRELYTALCAEQDEEAPAYWAPLTEPGRSPESSANDPLQTRKELGPRPESFIWAPKALPEFGWWTLDCIRDSSGNALDVTRTLTAQLDAHALPLAIAHRRKSVWTEKAAGAWEGLLREVQSAAKDEAVGVVEDFLGQALNVALPGIGPLLGLGIKGVGAAKDRYKENQLLNREVTSRDMVAKAGRSRAEEMVRGLRSLACPTLPGIVVIEDLHRMDASFANFLDAAAESDPRKPLLVIGTVWPEGFNNPGFSEWFESRGGRVSELIEIPELSKEDLVRILLEYAPNTSVTDARVIVERFGTPHFLKLWLTCRGTQKLIEKQQGALIIDETLMDDLPDDIKDVMKERWKELPTEARQALGLAVAAQPQGAEGLPSFLPEIINGLHPPVPLPEGRSIQEGMRFAIDPSAWCRLSQNVASLREESLHRVVQDQLFSGANRWDTDEVQLIRSSAVDALVQWVALNVPVTSWLTPPGAASMLQDEPCSTAAESHAAAEWLLRLDPDGTTLAHGWAHLDLANQHRRLYAYPAAISATQKAIAIVRLTAREQSPFLLVLRDNLASLFAESGNLDAAIEIQKQQLLDAAAILGPDNMGTLVIRRSLAEYLTDAGDLDAAYEQLQPLLDDHLRVLGSDHPHTLTARAFLAECIAQRGRRTDAVGRFRTLLTDQTRILGKDHPNTLSTRGSLIEYSKSTADGDATKNDLEKLLADRTRVLGERHPSSLGTRRDLANALATLGDFSGAIELGREVLADHAHILGTDHPDTLVARGNLATHIGVTGRVDEALQLTTELVQDKSRILGRRHPDTLSSRGNLASFLAQADRHEEAIIELETLHEDCLRTLGNDHPQTMRTLAKLIPYIAVAGPAGEAYKLAEKLLDDRYWLLGPEHPDTVQSQELLVAVSAIAQNQMEDSKVEHLIAELLGPNAEVARGALLSIGVYEDGGFRPADFDQLTSWRSGRTRYTIIYSSQAMLLFTNDTMAGVASYSQEVLDGRLTGRFIGLTGERHPLLAEGIL